jgi:hypothetical protein
VGPESSDALGELALRVRVHHTGSVYFDEPSRGSLIIALPIISLGLALSGLLAFGTLGLCWQSIREHADASAVAGWGLAGGFAAALTGIFLEAWLKSAITLVSHRRFERLTSPWLKVPAIFFFAALLALGVVAALAKGSWAGVGVSLTLLVLFAVAVYSGRD